MKNENILSTQELLNQWLQTKRTEKTFAVSNYVKNNLIMLRGQTQKNKAVQKYENIITALLIDTCAYLVSKQFDIKITFDIENRQIIFADLQNIDNNLTTKQKIYYNNYFDCNFGISEEELKESERKQNEQKMLALQETQSLYDALGIPVELAGI